MRCLIFLLFVSSFLKAQIISNEEFTKSFAVQVNSIDDFFERFNFKENSPFQNFLKMKYPQLHYTRKNLIPTLFNQKNTTINQKSKDSLLANVTDSIDPKYINYGDKDWYAELTCSIIYYGKPKNLTLILKVEGTDNNRYSWTIVSAKADFLKFKATKADSILLKTKDSCCVPQKNKSITYFLTPISHGIDFTNIDNVFTNQAHIDDYIYTGARSFELCKLISLVKQSKIKYKQIDNISYHLLQLDGWIMKVNYFSRNDYNSGWLINELIKANTKEKENYRLKNLNLVTN